MDLLSLLIGFLLGVAAATLAAIGIARFRAAIEQLERDEHWFHD
ncbi:hypothetical protein BLA9940_02094 [Burkholderia aenigmatica]|nr:hypothetical protein [Burkholderia aenigmatica]VWC53758.1 hypothetical protein BLA9940_02094 [Burkholderia aenigmatica]